MGAGRARRRGFLRWVAIRRETREWATCVHRRASLPDCSRDGRVHRAEERDDACAPQVCPCISAPCRRRTVPGRDPIHQPSLRRPVDGRSRGYAPRSHPLTGTPGSGRRRRGSSHPRSRVRREQEARTTSPCAPSASDTQHAMAATWDASLGRRMRRCERDPSHGAWRRRSMKATAG